MSGWKVTNISKAIVRNPVPGIGTELYLMPPRVHTNKVPSPVSIARNQSTPGPNNCTGTRYRKRKNERIASRDVPPSHER